MADFGTLGLEPETPESRVEKSQPHKRLSVLTATALLALSLVAGKAGAETKNTNPPQTESQPIVLAQSAETDGKVYIVAVLQIDGTKKKVEYTKKKGIIQPPAVTNGKLVDGSKATGDAIEDRATNRSILARYDKDHQIVLAMIDKGDILGKADQDMQLVITKVKSNDTSLSKTDLFNWFVGAYVANISGADMNKAINGLEAVGKIKLKLSPSELNTLKSQARKQAEENWKSVTGAVTA